MLPKEIIQQIKENGVKNDLYFLIDCGAFIMPYLKFNLYTFNRCNITPFIKLLELYMSITSYIPNSKFLFTIDNGLPDKIVSMYPAYKANRKHSKHRREDKIFSRDIYSTNEYVTNRTLIAQFFTLIGEGVLYYSEADYQLGYALKKVLNENNIDGSQCYVISHDKDLMALIPYCNCIRKLHLPKEKSIKFWLFNKGSYDEYLQQNMKIYSYEEFIIMKSLIGDIEDNIKAPIMMKKSLVTKIFNDWKFKFGYYSINIEQTFEIIKDKIINKYIKKYKDENIKKQIEQQLALELRRNYLIFDVFNSDILFKESDKRYMDIIINAWINNSIKKNYSDALNTLNQVSISYSKIFKNWLKNVHDITIT